VRRGGCGWGRGGGGEVRGEGEEGCRASNFREKGPGTSTLLVAHI